MALPLFLAGAALGIVAFVGLPLNIIGRAKDSRRTHGNALVVRGTTRSRRTGSHTPARPKTTPKRPPPRPRPPRLRGATVSVVVPTLNEAESVDWVLDQLPSWVSEVVLVDGLSTDHTEVVARELLADLIVVHQAQPGKGAALRAGFAAATGDIIVMIDADGSTNPSEMDRFVQALQEGAEFVKGSRHIAGGGSSDLTHLRSAGNRGFVLLANLLYGCDFTDLCYGYCAFWQRNLDALALTADGFEIETQLVLNAVKAGLKVREVPSFEMPRRAGTSNLNAFRDGRRVLRTIMAERFGRNSRRAAPRTQITLIPVELASPGSETWIPAGNDHRRVERRRLNRLDAGNEGADRRSADRRRRPSSTVTVFRAVDVAVKPEAARVASRAA
jgi:glycosyltransferase involved in cell wall biosynthesis